MKRKKKEKDLLVIALGGNAFLRPGEERNFANQNRHIRDASKHLADIVESGHRIAITHGNGPQIGDTLLRHEAGQKMFKIPALPMDVCVAETQGSVGYMIQQALRSELKRRKLNRIVVSILTRVIIDRKDDELRHPTKPVGPFYSAQKYRKLTRDHPNYSFAYDRARKGWRRLIVSPNPKRIGIAEQAAIKLLVDSNCIAIACGGGGIPVIEESGWRARGIEAVVDKDLASERLATLIGADRLVILTDVESAFVNYGKTDQRKLVRITAEEARRYINEGQFAQGSMEPKMLAALHFVESGGKSSVICDLSKVSQALQGKAGTTIIP